MKEWSMKCPSTITVSKNCSLKKLPVPELPDCHYSSGRRGRNNMTERQVALLGSIVLPCIRLNAPVWTTILKICTIFAHQTLTEYALLVKLLFRVLFPMCNIPMGLVPVEGQFTGTLLLLLLVSMTFNVSVNCKCYDPPPPPPPP